MPLQGKDTRLRRWQVSEPNPPSPHLTVDRHSNQEASFSYLYKDKHMVSS